jgi:hypothetical protein
MLSFGAKMLSFGANVIIWCYHVMLSSGMITPPYFIFPENFTHSKSCARAHHSNWSENLAAVVSKWRQKMSCLVAAAFPLIFPVLQQLRQLAPV